MKKNLLLTTVLMMAMSVASAQSDGNVKQTKSFVPEHEIRVGYSPLMPLVFGDNCQDKADNNYSENGKGWVGALSFLYSYKIYRWFEVGGVFTYAGEYETRSQSDNPSIHVGYNNVTKLTIAPNLRFSWYNSRVVRFYSSISLGVGIEIWKEKLRTEQETHIDPAFAFQVTPIGMSVGRKFFFYIEPLCFGTQGNLVLAGLGYRFPAKSQTFKY